MTAPRTTGATAAGEHDKRTLWPWLLLATLLAGLLVWWLVAAMDGDGDDVDPGASTAIEETSDPAGDDAESTADAATPVGGTFLVDGRGLFDPSTDLAASVGRTVEADTVFVVAVVADDAFLAGRDASQNILVRLTGSAGGGGLPSDLRAGEQISFSGTLAQVDQALLSELALFAEAPDIQPGDYYVRAEEISPVD
ncbi:hypothetical protein [Blastococcus goldschmidtiae]|uniref:tRNA_anti-like n=1 Tax=Blastococcus goldschmidtiae TaxID=3075546 RepID=A0ABU2K3I6_9ACTN|nr:hypothetical protein [Blastococcus sp. DSM 46792]MDT0274761.1 hypothetical protein [Blastococcus sp. DSM 46792]